MTDGLKKIGRYICGALFGLLGALAGYQAAAPVFKIYLPDAFFAHGLANLLSMALFGFIGVLLAPYFMKLLHNVGVFLERQLRSTAWSEITAALTGMIVGLVLADLLMLPFSDAPFGPYLTVLLNVLISFVMAWIFVIRQQDIYGAMASVKERLSQKQKTRAAKNQTEEAEALEPSAGLVPRKILDTSVIIDGRILDIAKTGFLQGILILPSFVLFELQTVADSKDQNRRARGRMGLDVVKELQKLQQVKLVLTKTSLADYHTEFVDSAVVSMAQKFGYDVLTTDYNLNKVAQIQNVRVLNVNDLANAMKPALLPGDEVTVRLIKEGKNSHQAIGYLDNGTMLVVKDGGPSIGKTVKVTVSSLLQTSAGRMVFGHIKHEVKS